MADHLIGPAVMPGSVGVGNPYLEEVRPFIGPSPFGGKVVCLRFTSDLAAPVRPRFVVHYAWAIPTDEPLSALAELGPIVELGAGTGYWTWQLRQRGVDVVAYDLNPPPSGRNPWHPRGECATWTEVRRGGTPRVALHPDRTLLLCWPPYGARMASDTLRAYGGSRVAYIGEGDHGCTADGRFHRLLDREWKQVARIAMLQWEGLHDELTVWERRP